RTPRWPRPGYPRRSGRGRRPDRLRPLLRPLWRARLARARVKLTLEKTTEGSIRLPHRRQFLHLIAGTAAVPPVSGFARGQAYPARPVRIIVGYAVGGRIAVRGCSDGRLGGDIGVRAGPVLDYKRPAQFL